MVRSSSLPVEGNPFWSSKARGEWELAVARPEALPPIPPDSDLEDFGSAPVEDEDKSRSKDERVKSRERGRTKKRHEAEGSERKEVARTPEKRPRRDDEDQHGSGGLEQWETGLSGEPKESLEEAMSKEVELWMEQKAMEDQRKYEQQQAVA